MNHIMEYVTEPKACHQSGRFGPQHMHRQSGMVLGLNEHHSSSIQVLHNLFHLVPVTRWDIGTVLHI